MLALYHGLEVEVLESMHYYSLISRSGQTPIVVPTEDLTDDLTLNEIDYELDRLERESEGRRWE